MASKTGRVVIGAVEIVPVTLRVRHDGQVMVETALWLSDYLNSIAFFENAPFEIVSIIIRYGGIDSAPPKVGRVSKRYNELALTFELRGSAIKDLDRAGLKEVFVLHSLRGLQAVAERFGLPVPSLNVGHAPN